MRHLPKKRSISSQGAMESYTITVQMTPEGKKIRENPKKNRFKLISKSEQKFEQKFEMR